MRVLPALIVLLLSLLVAAPGRADDDDDYRKLEQARERGEILALTDLLERLKLDGEVIEIDVDEDDGRIIYEIYYVDARGRRHEIEVDAATAEILDRDSDDDDDDNDDGDD